MPATSGADPPDPINSALVAFPGAATGPSSAPSAGLAIADRWIGDGPFGNPAAALPRAVSASPLLLRFSRQDLRADNRRFDEQAAFLDAASGWLGFSFGGTSLGLYAFQPLVRLEENAFERGQRGGPTPPAVIRTSSRNRELRAGLMASYGRGPMRWGVAGEWTRREDSYRYHETSGSPEEGERSVSFSGEGFGFQAGALLEFGRSPARSWRLGAAIRHVPALSLSGRQNLVTLVRDTTLSVSAERQAGWEGGLSARCAVSPAIRLFASLGGRTAQEWRGFDVTSGAGTMWSVAGEYHDSSEPWTARLGVGGEQQNDVPEPRAGILGLGFGWRWGKSSLDVGVVRRSIARANHPTSYDDRVVGSVRVGL